MEGVGGYLAKEVKEYMGWDSLFQCWKSNSRVSLKALVCIETYLLTQLMLQAYSCQAVVIWTSLDKNEV